MQKGRINIVLDSGFRITSLPRNFVLEKISIVDNPRLKSHGQTIWTEVGFYPSVQALCTRLVDHILLKSDATSIAELRKDLREIKEMILTLDKELS